MNPCEYANLANVENQHWFYVGKRQIVRHWIQRVRPLSQNDLLADCGAGTGTFAAEMIPFCRVVALDDHEESLDIARSKLGPERVKKGSCTNLPLENNSIDVLTALDVIEHVEHDAKALAEFHRVLRPGGIAVITVPALMLLWSDWDVALHHFRRYTRSSLLKVVTRDPFAVVHCNYVNVAALPLILLVRKWRALKLSLGGQATARSEDQLPPRLINALLKWSFVAPARQGLVRFPAGVGLLAVLRKRP